MATKGTADPRRDLPDIPASVGAARPALEAIREAVQTYLGNRGNPLDQGVTWRQLVDQGVVRRAFYPGAGGGGPGGIAPGGYTPIGGEIEPDLTPPPTPTGFSGSSGFSTIFLQWDAPNYTQGHGHGQTNIYGILYPTTDPSPPVFSETALVSVVAGFTTIFNFATTLGTRWAFWIKFQSADGVESTSPAGGANGVQVTTGQVGNSDLGPLIITADKISAGTYEGINLVRNSGAEDGTVAWALLESTGTAAALTSDTGDKTSGSRSFRLTKASGANGAAFGCLAFPVIPGETYSVKLRLRGSSASTNGLYLRAQEKSTAPAGGYVTAALRDSVTELGTANGPIPSTWSLFEFTYTAPANRFWVSFSVYNWSASTALDLYFDDVLFGRQITASSIAAGSIAVGSAAIADGAIRNALIENAAIDNAKIANISAAKLTVGDGTIGGNLKSTVFTAGSAGWIIRPDGTAEFASTHIRGQFTASQINTNGLTIRDAAGNVVLSAGNPVAARDDNLISNPSGVTNSDGWSTAVGFGSGASVWSGGLDRWIQFNVRNNPYGPLFAVSPGDVFYVSFDSQPFRGGTPAYDMGLGFATFDATGAAVGNPYVTRPATLTGQQRTEGIIVIPAGVAYAQVYLYVLGFTFNGTTGYYCRGLTVRKQNAPGGGNVMPNGDFLQSSGGIPTFLGHYNNAGTAATYSVGGGGAIGTNTWTITRSGASPTPTTWGFSLQTATTAFGGWRANTSYVVSWYAAGTGNVVGSQFTLGWTNNPVIGVMVENPTMTGGFQRYTALINFGNNTPDPSGYFTTTKVPANGDILYLSALQVETGERPSGWAPAGVTQRNPITATNIGTYIANASIDLARINTASIGSLSALTATIGLLRTATTGERMEIASDVIRIYDASNVLRVRIGNLA